MGTPVPKPTKQIKKRKSASRNPKRSKKYYLSKIDQMVGWMVRQRGHCENPQCPHNGTYALQWAHIISRSYRAIRWDFDNAFCLCAGCHTYFTHRPIEWEIFVLQMIGSSKYEDLKRRALSQVKINLADKYIEVKQKYDALQGV